MNRSEEPRDELHERLCAYVLGELGGEEHAALEAELARSPELRAERERLERTIGLVQGFLGDDAGRGETLSPAATDHLMRRAGRPARVLRLPRPFLGLAAAAGFLGLAFLAWRAVDPRVGVRGVDGYVAKAPEESAAGSAELSSAERANEVIEGDVAGLAHLAKARELQGDAQRELRAGAAAKDELAPGQSAPAARQEAAESKRGRELAAGRATALGSLGYADDDADAAQPAPAEVGVLLQELGYADEEETPVAKSRRDQETLEVLRSLGYVDQAERDAESAARAGEGVLEDSVAASKTYHGPGDTLAPGGGSSAPAPSDGPAAAGQPASGAGSGGGKFGLRFGGRHDLKAADGSATPAGPATGPSSPGPSSRARVQTETGDADFFLGEGIRSQARPTAGRREHLGHLDDGESGESGLESRYRFQHDPGKLGLVDADELCRRVIERCRRRPDERPRDMFFRFWGDNAFVFAHQDPLATLSADVDTASYALARNYLRNGHLPPEAAVRTEEFLNYFAPDVPAPTESTFGIRTDLAPSRFGPTPDHWLLRVVVRGREVAREERKPLALTVVLDVSGSMKEHDRMELVKYGVRMLLGELDARDTIALVTFNDTARIVLGTTSAADRGAIETALHGLRPDGSTNAEAGLKLGYELASARFDPTASNRVVLFSDGVANVGQTDQDRLSQDVAARRADGLYLNTIGVGMGNHNDVFLEQLANRGDGVCNYVDTPLEAQRALVDNFLSAFVPIARDVKLQVEFDPSQVLRYRQLGYENRRVADADFRNDAVDAGELGSGHQVVALFELQRAGGADAEAPLATVRLRWKPPHGEPRESGATAETDAAKEIAHAVTAREAAGTPAAAGPGYLRSTYVAQFAEVLRGSVHAAGDSYELLLSESAALARELKDPDFTELVELQKQARDLLAARDARGHGDLRRTLDAVRRNAYLRAQLEELSRADRADELERLERENRDLERRLNDLLHRTLREQGPDELLRELSEL